jgi:hypothetical protein
MRDGWRRLAQRAANTNFEPTEISEAIPIAIKDDWNAEGCDQTVRELRAILEDDRQGSLFGQDRQDKLDALKDVSAASVVRIKLKSIISEVAVKRRNRSETASDRA